MDEEFVEWYRQNEKQLLHFALQRTQYNEDVARDAVQDAITNFLPKFRNVKPHNRRCYALRCVLTSIANIFRREKKTSNLPDHIMNQQLDDLAEAVADRNELREQLDKCMGKLPEKQLRVFLWVHVDENPQTELAKLEGVTPVAIHQRLRNAIIRLRECLNAYVTGA
jgi:RNA polymerase sigma factor (sigma-70 family)